MDPQRDAMTFEQKRKVLVELCPAVATLDGFEDALLDVFGKPENGSLRLEKGTPCQCLSEADRVFACIDRLPEAVAAVVERHGGHATSAEYADVQAIYTQFVRMASEMRGWLEAKRHEVPA